jgi:hypothetical protein
MNQKPPPSRRATTMAPATKGALLLSSTMGRCGGL